MIHQGDTIDGRYRVESKLGEGGLAVVYKVERLQLGTEHALKVLKRDGKKIRQRLYKEGQLQGKLRHPNIAAVTDIVDVEGMPGLVMEYVRGASLDDLLYNEPLTLEQIDHLARGVIRGVGAAHKAQLIHRDLKPANVLLEVIDGVITPKITDFGLAKALDEPSHTQAGVMMGTPQYMPPEQIEDASTVDHRADVWSLGVMLYEMCTGVRPFEHVQLPEVLRMVLDNTRKPVDEINPHLPSRMVEAIEGALTVDLDLRIASCDELLTIWNGSAPEPAVGRFTSSALDRLLARGGGREPTPAPADRRDAEATRSLEGARARRVASTVDVSMLLPSAQSPPTADHSLAVLGAGALSMVGMVGAVTVVSSILVVAGMYWWTRPVEVAVAPVAPVATPAPVAPMVPRPARLVETPRERAAPTPETPEPTLPAPAPVAEAPAPSPRPVTPPPVTDGSLSVRGTAAVVRIIDSHGAKMAQGALPPGEYRVFAAFPELGETLKERLVVTIGEGQAVRVRCELAACVVE